MALAIPFITYGTITNKNGGTVAGATVFDSTATTTTNSVGKYQLNIQDVATDGEITTITATYDGVSRSVSFTVDLDDIGKIINFMIPYDTKIGIYGNTYSRILGNGYMKVGVI